MLDYDEHAILADQRFYEALRLLLMHTELSEDLICCFDLVWTCGRYHERRMDGFIGAAQESADEMIESREQYLAEQKAKVKSRAKAAGKKSTAKRKAKARK